MRIKTLVKIVWSRRLDEFMDDVELDGDVTIQKRFVLQHQVKDKINDTVN